MSERYFHGGPPGLTQIKPPSLTGEAGLRPYGTSDVSRPDRVYVTTDFASALMYAVGHPSGQGVVYQVEPISPLEHDPDCTERGLSYACRGARVIKVYPVSDAWRHIVWTMLARSLRP